MSRLTRAVIYLAVLLMSTVGAGAEVIVRSWLGFNGLVKPNSYNPVIVEVENDGPGTTLTLTVESKKGATLRSSRVHRFSDVFVISAGARRRFDYAIPIESSGLPVMIRLYDGERLVSERTHEVLGKVVRTPLVVALSRSTAFDFLIPEAMVSYPHPELMPARWDGYLPVDIVILHDADVGRLLGAQVEALETWVDLGGSLLIVGGPHLTQVEPRLEALVPYSARGLERLDASNLLATLGISGEAVGEIAVSRFSSDSTGVAYRDGSTVLVSRVRRGAGSIVSTAFDMVAPPFDAARPRRAAWTALEVEPSRADIAIDTGRALENPVMTALIGSLESNMTERLIWLASAIGIAAIVFPALGSVAKAPRSALRWVTTLTVVSGLSVAIYWLFAIRLFPPQYLAAVTSVAEYHPGASYGRLSTDLLIVNTTRSSGTIILDEEQSIVRNRTHDTVDIAGRNHDLEIAVSFPLPWQHEAFRVESAVPMRFGTSVTAGTDKTRETITVRVVNDSEYLILGGVFIRRGEVTAAGPFAPESVIERTFRHSIAPVATSIREFADSIGDIDSTREAALTSILFDERYRRFLERDAILFVGWFSDPLFVFRGTTPFRHTPEHEILVIVLESAHADV